MTRVTLVYALSGLVSLGYQVAWLRIYVDRFGSSELTFVLVLANFIAGLGAGALASRRVGGALRRAGLADPLRQYGAIELAVSAAALLTFASAALPADLFGSFPYVLRDGVFEPSLAQRGGVIAVATLCVFVPCFFMGVTFPLLCDAHRDRPRFPALLYAWNTLGACSGVLLGEFVLLPAIGHGRMLLAFVALNALLGAYFLWSGSRASAAAAARPEAPAAEEPAREDGGVGTLLLCALLSGLLAGSLEADMFRRVHFLGIRTPATISFVSFWAVVAIFLGSVCVRALPRMQLWHVKLAWVGALLVYVAVTQQLFALHEWIFGGLGAAAGDANLPFRMFFPSGLLPLWLYVGILVLPAFLPIALLLPYVCNRLQSRRRHLGWAYGLNTVAFCVGTIAFTWVAPRVSSFYSMKLAIVFFGLGVALLALLSETRRLALWKPGLAVAALLVGCALTPADFDRSYMIPKTLPTKNPIRAIRSDSSHTTFVVAYPDGDMLFFDNVGLSNATHSNRVYMGLMAHFPMLAQRDPRDVLLICYGAGNTAGAISTHETLERLDVVELSRNVIETAPEFAQWNQGVHLDPRVRFIHDDGRNFLRISDARYDLVTSEPPPPLHTGVHRLYSEEYYRDVLAHLKPEGMMSQWLPVSQLPPEAMERIVATFVGVFPESLAFVGIGEELILLGSRAPFDLGRIERRFAESERVRAHLAYLGVPDSRALVARVVQGPGSLRRNFGGGPRVRDAHNDLALLFLDPGRRAALRYEPRAWLEELPSLGVEPDAALREALGHLGRLQYHVPGFALSSIAALPAEEAARVALADVDWPEVRRLEARAQQARAEGRAEEARSALRRALALADEHPGLWAQLAELELASARPERALDAQRRVAALVPDDAESRRRLAYLEDLVRRHDRNRPSPKPPGLD